MNCIIEFLHWFASNIYSNTFTLFTVFLSGIVSLFISKYYYDKGNRNNLKMNVIHPICRLLHQTYSKNNYISLVELSKDYSIRYMKDKEIDSLNSLIAAYNDVVEKNEINIYTNALFSYFEMKLKQHNIEFRFFPIEYEGEIINYDYHPDLKFMYNELLQIMNLNYFREEIYLDYEETTEFKVKELFCQFAKNCYGKNDIKFFSDYSLDKVLEESKHTKEWKNKIEICNNIKRNFLNLKICK